RAAGARVLDAAVGGDVLDGGQRAPGEQPLDRAQHPQPADADALGQPAQHDAPVAGAAQQLQQPDHLLVEGGQVVGHHHVYSTHICLGSGSETVPARHGAGARGPRPGAGHALDSRSVGLHLYDTATRAVRPFAPRTEGEVGIYLCGATVQGAPHIGHIRAAVAVDVLRRWLERNGQRVRLVRNVTDIDDKILAKSAEAGVPWWAWAYRFEREFTWAYDAVGVLPPTYEPRATGHVTEMVELMQRLVDRGHAYPGEPGNVYFDVRSWAGYGELTHQQLEHLGSGDDETTPPPDKRDPLDFALWKAPKPGEPASAAWPTPYGRGRPGWHLECSAMAHRYLGEAFDIHAGGIDLRFPHHENEQAQSRAAGWGFAGLWFHNAWVTVGGEKMSKSLGNSLLVREVLRDASPAVLRYALGGVHYRSTLEYTPGASLVEAGAAWERITGFVSRAAEVAGAAD